MLELARVNSFVPASQTSCCSIPPHAHAVWQAAEEALEQGVWADAAAGQLWAAQRLGPTGAPPAEVWRALAALGARPRRLAWLANTLLVRRGGPAALHSLGLPSSLLADQRCASGCAACCPARLASMQSLSCLEWKMHNWHMCTAAAWRRAVSYSRSNMRQAECC
jgi:hypothetical protein